MTNLPLPAAGEGWGEGDDAVDHFLAFAIM
jgi:hypothetical protein